MISGPGGTMWGANAVNGVINILTKSSASTQGLLASAGGGDEGNKVNARYGGRTSGGYYRIYGQAGELPNQWRASGTPLQDGSRRLQGRFRADWAAGPRWHDGAGRLLS